MEIDTAEPPPRRSRERRLPGVATVLSKPLHGQALPHWGESTPPRDARVEPVDVTGPGTPRELPAPGR